MAAIEQAHIIHTYCPTYSPSSLLNLLTIALFNFRRDQIQAVDDARVLHIAHLRESLRRMSEKRFPSPAAVPRLRCLIIARGVCMQAQMQGFWFERARNSKMILILLDLPHKQAYKLIYTPLPLPHDFNDDDNDDARF